MSDLLTRAYRDIAARLRMRPDADIVEVRAMYEDLHRVTTEPERVSFTAADADGVPALWCVPDDADERFALLYVHGGGFQLGSIALYRKLVGHIAAAAGIPAVVFDYRLAPEHPYPAQLIDTAVIQRWLTGQGIAPEQTVILGDSAGANLATAHVLCSLTGGSPAPAGIVAMSPWYDLTLSSLSVTALRHLDMAVSRSGLLAMRQAYLQSGPMPEDPVSSPIYADLSGLPPTLLLTGDHEILLDDTLRFDEKASAAGVSVETKIYPGMPHVFALLAGCAVEADDAVTRAGRWARHCLNPAARLSHHTAN